MSAMDMIWPTRGSRAVVRAEPLITSEMKSELEDHLRGNIAEIYGSRPIKPRTVATVHDELESNTQQLDSTIKLAKDLVDIRKILRAELATLIKADRAKFHGALQALEDLERRIGDGKQETGTETPAGTAEIANESGQEQEGAAT